MVWNRWLESDRSLPLLLYAALFGCFAAGAGALYSSLENPAQTLVPALISYALGLISAYLCRTRPWLKGVSLVGGLLLAGGLTFLPGGDFEGAPPQSIVAFILSRIAIFLAFLSASDDSALFLLVVSAALLIAANTQTVDPSMVAYALAFCLLGAFSLLTHAHLKGWARSRARAGALIHNFYNLATLGSITFLVSAAIGLIVMVPLHVVGSAVRPFFMGSPMPLHPGKPTRGPKSTPTLAGAAMSSSSVDVGQGPASVSHEPVLLVQATEPHYLLGAIFTDYDNHGWTAPEPAALPLRVPIADGYQVQLDSSAARWRRVKQRITLLQPSDVVPAFARVETVEARGVPLNFAIDDYGCIRTGSASGIAGMNRVSQQSFLVQSAIPPDLDSVTSGRGGPNDPSPATPAFASARVSAVASSLRGADAIATAHNIVRYLQAHCTYDLNAPAVPTGSDAVDFFVFQSHAGYCDLFATSAAVLLQMDGFPARYCTGYVPGKLDPERGGYVETGAERHAWVEVYVRGSGWLQLDATPPGFDGPFNAAVAIRDFFAKFRVHLPPLDFEHLVLYAAFAGIAYFLYGLLPGVRLRKLRRQFGGDGVMSQALLDYWRMERMLAGAGAARRFYETPFEFQRRLEGAGLPEEITDSVAAITRRFVSVRYADQDSGEDLAPQLIRLRRALRLPETRRLLRPRKDRQPGHRKADAADRTREYDLSRQTVT